MFSMYLHILKALQKNVEEKGQNCHEVDKIHHTVEQGKKFLDL